jgi:hypothetical protein
MSPMNTREEIYHMTAKEMTRLKVAERLLAGEIRVKDAADGEVKDLVVELKIRKYSSTNFSHFTELLEEKEELAAPIRRSSNLFREKAFS